MRRQNSMNKLSSGTQFCAKCGTPIPGFAERAVQPEIIIAREPSTGKTITIIVLSVLLAAVITLLLIMAAKFFSKKEKPVPNISETPVTEEYQHEPPQQSATSGSEIFPSDRQYITASDLSGLSPTEVSMIRNEIYARHGYIFRKEPFKSYFESQPWYVPNQYFTEDEFSAIEKANKTFIVEYERNMGWIE